MSSKTSNFVEEENSLKNQTQEDEALKVTEVSLEDNLDQLDESDLDLDLDLDLDAGQNISDLDLTFDEGLNLELTGLSKEKDPVEELGNISQDDTERLGVLIKRAKVYLNDFSGDYTRKLGDLSKKMTKEFVKLMEEYTPNTSNASSSILQSIIDTEDALDIEDEDILQDETNYQVKCRNIRAEAVKIKEKFTSIINEITEDTVSEWVDTSIEDEILVKYYIGYLNISNFFYFTIKNSTNFRLKLENILKEFVIKAKGLYKTYGKNNECTPLDLVIQAKENYVPLRLMTLSDISYDLQNEDNQIVTCPNCNYKQKYQTLLFTKSLKDLSAKQAKDFKFGHIPFLCENCGQISALSENTLVAINEHLRKKFFGVGNTLLYPDSKDMLASPDSSFLRSVDEINLTGDTVDINITDNREMSVTDIKECLQECEKYNILQYYESLLSNGDYAKCENILRANIKAFTSFKNIVQATFAYLVVLPTVKDLLDLLNLRDAVLSQEILLNQVKKNCEYFIEQTRKGNTDSTMQEHMQVKMSNIITAYTSNGFTFLSLTDYDKNLKAINKFLEVSNIKLKNIDKAIEVTMEHLKKYIYDYIFNMQYYSTDTAKIAKFSTSRFFTLFKTQEELDNFMQDAMSAVTMKAYTANFLSRDLTKANAMKRARWTKDEPIDNLVKTLNSKGFLATAGSIDYFNPLTDVMEFVTTFGVKNSDILTLYNERAGLGKALLTKTIANLNLDNENLTAFYCLNNLIEVIDIMSDNNNSLLNDLKTAINNFFATYPVLKISFNNIEEKDYTYYITLREAGFTEQEATSLLMKPRLPILRRKQNETVEDYISRVVKSNQKTGLRVVSHDFESAELSTIRELLRLIYSWVDTIHENKYNKSPFLILTLNIKALMKYRYTSDTINLLFDSIILKPIETPVIKPSKLTELLDLRRIIETLCDFDSADGENEKANAGLNDVMCYTLLLEPEKIEQYTFENITNEFSFSEETNDLLTYAAYVELYSMCDKNDYEETSGMSTKDLETYINYTCLLNKGYREKSIILNAYPNIISRFDELDLEFTEFKKYLNTKYNLRR